MQECDTQLPFRPLSNLMQDLKTIVLKYLGQVVFMIGQGHESIAISNVHSTLARLYPMKNNGQKMPP